MNHLDQATKLTGGKVWPNAPVLYPDDDLVIEVIIDEESAPDSVGDLYEPMDYNEFKALLEADFEWIADTVKKMASEVAS